MQSIEDLAVQTYQNNLEYFKNQHPALIEKLNIFNASLENGQFAPKYDLEYMKSYFDVKELKSSNYLYGANSEDISKELTKQVNFKKDSNIFEGFPLYYNYEKNSKDFNDKDKGNEGIYPIMTYYLDNSKQTDEMKVIEKFIFIGVGLGLHLLSIDQKIKAEEYLIIEDDIELFRLSLFTTPYYELAKGSKLYFSVADDENIFLLTTNAFLENNFFKNRYLKYSYFPAHSDNKLKQIQNAITSQNFILFPFKTVLKKFLRPLEFINEQYNVVNLSKHFDESVFFNKPTLLITAGPSLKKNIEWLKQNHHKFIIIAISSTLNTLYENNITPDVVTHLDGFDTSVVHFENFPVQDFLKNTIFIFGPFTPSKIRNMFKKEHIFYYEEGTQYFKGYDTISASCLGSTTLLQAIMLNTKELYLLGLDLALDQETGETHSSNHAYGSKNDLSNKDKLNSAMSTKENIFPVKGNFEKVVYTSSLFHRSVQSLYNKIPMIKQQNQTIYNLNDGAYINATTPMQINDINVDAYESIDKNLLFDEIYSTLSKNSSNKLSQEDISSLKEKLDYSKKIKEYLDNYKNITSYTNADKYLYDFLGLISDLLTKSGRESDNLVLVYYHFFKYVLPIVVDLLNTKGLKNTKRHIKKLDALIQKEMFIIENIYEERLKDFLQKRS